MADERETMGIGSLAIAAVLALIVGVFVGGITSFTHRQWPIELGGGRFPLGLVVGILIVAAVVVGVRLAFGSRVIALGAAIGVIAAIAVLGSRGPGGSVVIVQDWVGWTWVATPVLVALIAVALPGRRAPRSPREQTSGPSRSTG